MNLFNSTRAFNFWKKCLQHIHSIVIDGLQADIHTTRLEPRFSSIITKQVYWSSLNILKGIFVAIICSYVVTLVEMNNNHAENNLGKRMTQNVEMCIIAFVDSIVSIPVPLRKRFWTSSIQRLNSRFALKASVRLVFKIKERHFSHYFSFSL